MSSSLTFVGSPAASLSLQPHAHIILNFALLMQKVAQRVILDTLENCDLLLGHRFHNLASSCECITVVFASCADFVDKDGCT